VEVSTLLVLCDENSKNDYQNYRINSVELLMYMGGEGITSRECLLWRDIDGKKDPQCLPIGGQSIWGAFGNLNKQPKVVLTVAFDTTAEFHDLAFGSNEAMGSLAVVLIVAEALSRVTDASSGTKQPLIFLANADEWGYAGSRRFVRDITSFVCGLSVPANQTATGLPMCLDPLYPTTLFQNIDFSDIDAVIAVDQIGLLDSTGSLYLHHLPVYSSKSNAATATQADSEATTAFLSAAQDRGIILAEVGSIGDDSSYALPPVRKQYIFQNVTDEIRDVCKRTLHTLEFRRR
jgi:hypothetical protein